MATLKKWYNKSGYIYAVDFYYHGKRHVKSTKTSDFRLAKRIKSEIEGRIARGIFNLEEYAEKHVLLVDFLNEYFRSVESSKAKGTVSLEKIITNSFRKCLGNVDLRTIDARHLDEWKATRCASVNATTFNIELRTLHAILNVARSWKYIDVNPFAGIKKLKEEEKRLYMTSSELKSFFETLADIVRPAKRKSRRMKGALLGPFYEFLLNTGLRREEAITLTTNDIDYERGLILVRKTKDKEARAVPLSERAKDILDSVGPSTFSMLTKDYVTHNFTAVCKKANLNGFKLHSLRHTFATQLIDRGVDVLTVSKILGHSDIKTTMIYAKVRLESLRNAVRLLEEKQLPVRKWLAKLEDETVKQSTKTENVENNRNFCARDRT